MKCYKCGHSYHIDEMRYGPDGRTLMCINCIERRPVNPIKIVEPGKKAPKKIDTLKEDLVDYRCTSCNYKFRRAARLHVTRCPYCSEESVESDTGVQSLIDHADDEDKLIQASKRSKKW